MVQHRRRRRAELRGQRDLQKDGRVIAQQPQEGAVVVSGSRAFVTVAQGGINVPNVTGSTRDGALNALRAQKLQAIREELRLTPTGTAGTIVDPGSQWFPLPGSLVQMVVQ